MKIKDSRGFTLIELVVSISILSIIGLAFFSAINTSIKTNKKNETDIKAMHLAQSEMENLRIQIKNYKESTPENDEINICDSKDNPVPILTEDYKKNEDDINYILDDYGVKITVIKKDDLLYEIMVIVFELNKNFSNKDTKIITRVVKGRG